MERMETLWAHPLTLIPPSDLFLVVSVGMGVEKAFPDHKFIIILIRIILKSYFPPLAVFKCSADFCGPDVRQRML